jgi:2-dehydro-3-deoxygalactonokinase
MNSVTPDPSIATRPAAVVGIDWGTTHRRVSALDDGGTLLREFADDDGMLRAGGRFPQALQAALAAVAPLAAAPRVLMSGMVGSAQGWHEVPYVDIDLPLAALASRLFAVPDAPAGASVHIVPGYRLCSADGRVDVMRGEETQLLGAAALGLADAVVVLPGTHSKWVRLRAGRIEGFATYMSGELFALLSQHGTLAPLLRESVDDDDAFDRGLAAGRRGALSNVLFECRARVVAGRMPALQAREYLSGVLIGAEWHDALQRFGAGGVPLHVLGSAELAARYRRAAERLGVPLAGIDARAAQLAAWRALCSLPTPSSTLIKETQP